jgi:DNA-binding winged helix-turn-helix (wHTH) protein/TolB-like protein/Tfp pilus assembly protein PilF
MKQFYEFGPFRLDKVERQLLRNGGPVSLTPKAFDTLLFLVENRGHVLPKAELMQALWPGSFVEEGNLTDNISKLRQALGDDRRSPKYIETVARRGYRFIAAVEEVGNEEPFDVKDIKPEQEQEQVTGNNTAIREEGDQPTESNLLSSMATRWPNRAIVAISVVIIGLLFVFSLAGKWSLRQPDLAVRPIKSIAILPFKPLVDADRDEMLELGMADSLIARLGRLGQLLVRPTSAVRKYTRVDDDAVVAGREQHVDAVLDSSIQRSGDMIRVASRLVTVPEGRQIWEHQFDRKFTDIFAIQDSISEEIAKALELQLTGGEKALMTRRYTDDTEAYELYQLGRYFWNRATTEEDLEKAIQKFNQALTKDPQYALAYVGLADSYGALAVYGYKPMTDSYPRAMEAAERALKIDEMLGEAHTSLAVGLADYDRDWTRAEQHYRRGIELSPNHPQGRYYYAGFLAGMGRFDEAIREAKQGQKIDPLSPNSNVGVAYSLNLARRYDEAIQETLKALELDGGFGLAHAFLVESYLGKKMYNEAIATLQKLERSNPLNIASLGYAYAMSGRPAEARKILKELDQLSSHQNVPAICRAKIYIGLNEKDRAFEALDQALDERAWEFGMVKTGYLFDPLRSDPRFISLLRRVGLTP